jgi:rRNA maturation endonuclease Nob1
LRALDQLLPAAVETPAPDDVDAEIEQLIAARRVAKTAPAVKSANSKAACPQCHKPVRAADKFCPSCGAKLV